MSVSVQWRTKGNKLYCSSQTEGGVLASIRVERLYDAVNFYHRALQTGVTDGEKASASKNIGQCYLKIATHLEHTSSDYRQQRVIYSFQEAANHFCKAHQLGADVKTVLWLDGVLQSLYQVLEEALRFLATDQKFEIRAKALENFISVVHIDLYKAELYIELTTAVFRHGIYAVQNGDYKTCLRDMHNCYYPLEEARRFSRRCKLTAVMEEAEVLEKDIFIHLCVAESIQARFTGDELIRHILDNEEAINMDLLFDAIDWYRRAMILTREGEVELEAIALSQLGHVYDKILKLEDKAKENYMRCMQLVEIMHPRTFHSRGWFNQCTEALSRFQRLQVEREEAAKEKENEPYLKELTEELKQLNENDQDASTLLLFIYDKFPPKNPEHTLQDKDKLNEVEFSAKKKILLKAVLHYHPDKQSIEDHGKKWHVLCQEITKLLTRKYECFKG